jgi:diguanylate cyclase (GGDEF)-like protein
VTDDPRLAAYLEAYAAFEGVQSEDHAAIAASLPDLRARAERAGWDEVAFVVSAAETLYTLIRAEKGPEEAAVPVDALLQRAERLGAPAFIALALGLRALVASARGQIAQLLQDTARAVGLLGDDALPPLDRCTAYVVAAAAYNTLSLWEVVDELYDEATALLPLCPGPGQEPALAINRVLIRLEWATALIELDELEQARVQLERSLAAVADTVDVPLSDLWRSDVEGMEIALRLLLDERTDELLGRAAEQSALLRAAGDIEVVPLLEASRALALLGLGRQEEAAAVIAQGGTPVSASSGARSFPAWVAACVAAGAELSPGVVAFAEYAALVARRRWEARASVLVAARSFLATEGLRADNDRISRDLFVDPLTGLQNRRAFDAWLERPPTESVAALLLVDLDGFKRVNDTYGHATGDEVLRRIGRILSEHVRHGDLALRHGGDEFAIVLEQDASLEPVVRRRADDLRNAIRMAPWSDIGPGLTVGVSIGVAVGSLRDGAARLYELADDALYQAKSHPAGVVLVSSASGS